MESGTIKSERIRESNSKKIEKEVNLFRKF